MLKKFAAVFFVVLLTNSCSKNYIVENNFSGFNNKTTLVLNPFCLSDIYKNNDEDAFNRNLYIGAVDFQGGVISDEETSYITRTRIKNFYNQDNFKKSVTSLFLNSIKTIFDKEKINYSITVADITEIITPDDINSFEDETRDENFRKDNINFPKNIYEITGVQDIFLQKSVSAAGVAYVLIPAVEYYYIHNSGWFNGQDTGCTSGYRARLHLYVFDAEKKQFVFKFMNDEKKIFERKYVFDRYEMKDWQKELNSTLKKVLTDIIPEK